MDINNAFGQSALNNALNNSKGRKKTGASSSVNNAGSWVNAILAPGTLVSQIRSSLDNPYMTRTDNTNNWFERLLSLGKVTKTQAPSNADLGAWFKDNYGDQFSGDVASYINSLDDATLGALIEDNYYKTTQDWTGSNITSLQLDDLINDLQATANIEAGPKLSDYLGNYQNLNYDDILKDAQANIDAENADILKMYDDNLNRQTANYNNEMNALRNNYANYAKQVMSNDYQKNAAMMGAYQSEMSRARQNSLEAGANAGLRIAGNINTLLSAQNKQASTSLETSNQLAQAMLNQQNAAAGIRSGFNNMLSADTTNRANLRKGSYERATNAATNRYSALANEYNVRKDQYDIANQIATERNGNYTNNAFYDSNLAYKKSNQARQANSF